MRNIKNDLEYKAELKEWENLYLRLRLLVEKKAKEDLARWVPELEKMESSWSSIKNHLVVLYGQPGVGR